MEDEHEGYYDGYDSSYMGAIFMSNRKTKEECFHWKLFGLPHSQARFVAKVKTGMILFLFEFEERKLYGVFEATSDGAMNIVPNAFARSGMSYPAQIHFKQIWSCDPLCEDEFADAIKENYYTRRKFNFGLSYAQVIKLIRLFAAKRRSDSLDRREPSIRRHNFHRNDIDDIECSIHDENDSNGYNGFSRGKSSLRSVDASYEHGFYTSSQGPHQGLANVIRSPSQNEFVHRGVVPGDPQIFCASGLPMDGQAYGENLVGRSRSPIDNGWTHSRSQSDQSHYGLEFKGLPLTDHLGQDLPRQEAFSRFSSYEPTSYLSFMERDYCPNIHNADRQFVERYDPSDSQIFHSRTTKFATEGPDSFHVLTSPPNDFGYSEAFQHDKCSGEAYNKFLNYIPLSNDLENIERSTFPSNTEELPASNYKSSKIKTKRSYKTVRTFHPSNSNEDYMASEAVGRTIYSDSLSNGGRDNVFSRLSRGPTVNGANEVYGPDTKISFDQFVDLLSQRRTQWNKMGKFKKQLPVKDFHEKIEGRFVKEGAEAASADMKQIAEDASGESINHPFVNFKRRSEVRKSDGGTKCNEHVGGSEATSKRRKLIRPVLDDDETLYKNTSDSITKDLSEKNSGSCETSKSQNDGDILTKGLPAKCVEHSENYKIAIGFFNDMNTYRSQTSTEGSRTFINKADSKLTLEESSTMNCASLDECSLLSFSGMNVETVSSCIVDEKSKCTGLTELESQYLKRNSNKEPDCSTKKKIVKISDGSYVEPREKPPAMFDLNCATAVDESVAVDVHRDYEAFQEASTEIYSTMPVASYVSKDRSTVSDGKHRLSSESQQEEAGNEPIVETSMMPSPRKHGDVDPVVLDIGNKAFSFTLDQVEKNSDDYIALEIGLS